MHHRPSKKIIPGLAERVKSKRLELGLSQQVAATRAGMSMNRLRDLERLGVATIDTVTRIARVLCVDVDHLTGRRLSPPSPSIEAETSGSVRLWTHGVGK